MANQKIHQARISAFDCIILFGFILLLSYFLRVAYSSWDAEQNRIVQHDILTNFASDGKAIVERYKKQHAEAFKNRAENLLSNIEKISIAENGDKFEIIVEFRERQ